MYNFNILRSKHLPLRVKFVNFALNQTIKAQSRSGVTDTHLGARWGWKFNATPRPINPREDVSAPFYIRLDGTQGGVDTFITLVPPGFDLCILQPVASRYTDGAVAAHKYSTLVRIIYN
jgi:hypothetical protein